MSFKTSELGQSLFRTDEHKIEALPPRSALSTADYTLSATLPEAAYAYAHDSQSNSSRDCSGHQRGDTACSSLTELLGLTELHLFHYSSSSAEVLRLNPQLIFQAVYTVKKG